MAADTRDIAELEALLDHSFADPQKLAQALTHRSYANERREDGLRDNERYEFLGDAVLDLVISHLLVRQFPNLREGDLSTTRAHMVSESGLAAVAIDLKLGNWLRLGKGEEQTGGRTKASLLADALEAICAAIYLDGGLPAAESFIHRNFAHRIPKSPTDTNMDYKTKLQEEVQRRHKSVPVYTLIDESGPAHEKLFVVAVQVDGEEQGRASGRTKKRAAQKAAKLALAALVGGDEE